MNFPAIFEAIDRIFSGCHTLKAEYSTSDGFGLQLFCSREANNNQWFLETEPFFPDTIHPISSINVSIPIHRWVFEQNVPNEIAEQAASSLEDFTLKCRLFMNEDNRRSVAKVKDDTTDVSSLILHFSLALPDYGNWSGKFTDAILFSEFFTREEIDLLQTAADS